MTARAVDAVIHGEIKLGTDVSVAAGPVKANVEAEAGAVTTATLAAHIYAFARAKRPFAGDSLNSVVIKARRD